MVRQWVRRQVKSLKISANGRIDLGPEEELIRLARSYIARPIHPLIAMLDGTIADGNRRASGMMLMGEGDREVDVVLTDEKITPENLKLFGLLSAIHRKDLSDYEKAVAMRDIKAAHVGMTNKQLCEDTLNMDVSGPTRYLSLFDCIQPVQQAAAEGMLCVSKWYAISKQEQSEQSMALTLALQGASRDELERKGRKARNGNGQTVKVSRVKCQLANACVTFAAEGDGVSLDEIIEALAELLKRARKANDEGLSAKTFEKTLRDKAEA